MTPEVQTLILEGIRLGLTRERSCNYAGVSVPIFYAFQAKNREFQDEVKRAESRCQAFHLLKIRKAAAEGQWQASGWMLERKWPEEFGKVDRHLIRMQQTTAPLPEQYIQAINRALGVRGELEVLGQPLLTSGNGDGAIDTDVLPQE